MRVLIDECLPRLLKAWLIGKHDAVTVQEAGWANIKNGILLRLANEAGFDVFVTADKNMYFSRTSVACELQRSLFRAIENCRYKKAFPHSYSRLNMYDRDKRL